MSIDCVPGAGDKAERFQYTKLNSEQGTVRPGRLVVFIVCALYYCIIHKHRRVFCSLFNFKQKGLKLQLLGDVEKAKGVEKCPKCTV